MLSTESNNSEMPVQWFAARVRKGQEFAVRDALIKLGAGCYVPIKVEIRQLKYRKKRVEIPLIKNIVFVHASKRDACDFHNVYGVQLFYMKGLGTNSMLVVPDKQMDDFIFMTSRNPDAVSISEDMHLAVGQKVKIIEGDLAGIAGILSPIENNTYVSICIEGVLTATVRAPKSYLKIIEK